MSISRVREQMVKDGIDAVIATSYENIAYLSRVIIMTQRIIPDRIAAVIVTLDNDPIIVVCSIEKEFAKRYSSIKDIRCYVEFTDSPIDIISGILYDSKMEKSRTGIEMRALSAHYYQELIKKLPQVSFVPVDELLESVRVIKSKGEIDLMQKAALATDRSIRRAFESVSSGDTDKTIANNIINALYAEGADSVAFLALGAGPNANLAHPFPINRSLQEGDIVRCDVGGIFSGYFSDLARTAIVGYASREIEMLYKKLFEIQEYVIESAHSGKQAKELYFDCKRAFGKRGMELELPHIGHSLGLCLHENPLINAVNQTYFEEDMVLAIEPIYIYNGFFLHTEDLVLVTPKGGKVLSRSTEWSDLFIINKRLKNRSSVINS
jgi:Xaa-Pro aminopeptidase